MLFCRKAAAPFPTYALGFDFFQQGFGAVFAADQVRVVFAPLFGEFAAEGLGEDGLGEVIDPLQGVVDLGFDGIGVGEELVYATDDFRFLFIG